MKKTVALLLDQRTNLYQQLLARGALSSASRLGIELVGPEYADGSSWTQAESINVQLRGAPPDGVVVMIAGSSLTKGPFERLAKAGVAVVLLNRIPEWLAELHAQYPRTLVAGVTPDQVGIGRIQGRQASRIVKPGGLVLLLTGTRTSPAASQRSEGFRDVVGERLRVNELDGGWSEEGAEQALAAWFRLGADRDRVPDLIACQNDAMALGARTALEKQARSSGVQQLEQVPLTGCDGLAEEGCARAVRGELAATIVMPPTTPTAFQILDRYWRSGERTELVVLEATPFPALEAMKAT